jgi:hypothetical protein
MGKLSLPVLCAVAALAIATNAHARGGTYHHPEPYAVHPDKHKTHGRPSSCIRPRTAITT